MSTEPDPTWQGAAAIRAHVERHIGPVRETFELGRGIGLLHSPPSDSRPFHTLITSGVSARPMPVPADADAPRRVELMATLPEHWQLEPTPRASAEWGWPMQLLASLAALLDLPGESLRWGQVVPNGEPPQAYAPTTKLCASIIAPSLLVPVSFYELGSGADRIAFYGAIPLYAEELALHRSRGMEHLLSRLVHHDVSDVIHPQRRNAAKRFFGLF